MSFVRTVLGDVPPESLGPTDYHEHLFQVTPLLPGDELDDEAASRTETGLLFAAGITAMVEATPIGLGRDPAAVARISAATGMRVVATTGAHREAHYGPDHPLVTASESDLAARFRADLVDGCPARDIESASSGTAVALDPEGRPVRAGLLKAGIGYWSISPFERRVLGAVAAAHRATGAAVMVHLEHGSAGHEVLDLLGANGVEAGRVVLAHADRNPDPGLHVELAQRGAYLGYDGMARHREQPDSALIELIAAVCGEGMAGHLLLGGDVARRSRYVGYGGMPGMAYLPNRFLPRLRTQLGSEVVRRIMVDAPAGALAWGIAG
ncbi:phosphotriesterase [Plantactinospora sp. BB1]|uniref:phosphotriesterase family protein n=1 Tax=Plantactinospora sp. BB1 TaxID=2071627 RepID=UPI000D157C92|nr:aryldialkylphosphatase [Plantactinospora sp. BB1]AVT40894.1 aryldialkylphosphatase [Plantactinospora sp. BB1]